jgi:hypothetical protein
MAHSLSLVIMSSDFMALRWSGYAPDGTPSEEMAAAHEVGWRVVASLEHPQCEPGRPSGRVHHIAT